MSRDSQITSLPESGWSCETLKEGVELAAKAAGLSLKNQDLSKAGGVGVMLCPFFDIHLGAHDFRCCEFKPVYIYIHIWLDVSK